jgi:hypothetical protein
MEARRRPGRHAGATSRGAPTESATDPSRSFRPDQRSPSPPDGDRCCPGAAGADRRARGASHASGNARGGRGQRPPARRPRARVCVPGHREHAPLPPADGRAAGQQAPLRPAGWRPRRSPPACGSASLSATTRSTRSSATSRRSAAGARSTAIRTARALHRRASSSASASPTRVAYDEGRNPLPGSEVEALLAELRARLAIDAGRELDQAALGLLETHRLIAPEEPAQMRVLPAIARFAKPTLRRPAPE